MQNVTSYNSAIVGEGTVVNDVERLYNSFEQLVTEYRKHSGTVNQSASVNVHYQYADGDPRRQIDTATDKPSLHSETMQHESAFWKTL